MSPGRMRVVALAASTGGPGALKAALVPLPADIPAALVVVQHIAPGFAQSLADSLAAESMLKVSVCRRDQPLEPGSILVAPAGRHLAVRARNGEPWAVLEAEPSHVLHRPSANVLFSSVAETCGPYGVGVVLTGMGNDGAEGLMRMREAGATTMAQDEATSIIHGMPRAAKEAGAVSVVSSLKDIPARIRTAVTRRVFA